MDRMMQEQVHRNMVKSIILLQILLLSAQAQKVPVKNPEKDQGTSNQTDSKEFPL